MIINKNKTIESSSHPVKVVGARELQVSTLRRKHGLPETAAGLIATLHFGEVQS